MQEVEVDNFCYNSINIKQPVCGFRVSSDSILLSRSVNVVSGSSVLDVGSGVGAASLHAVYGVPNVAVTAIELDPGMAQLCQLNYQENNITGRVICDDVSHFPLRGDRFDFVITNPPFYKIASGRMSVSKGCAHSETTSLHTWITFCLKRLKPKGIFSIIHTTDRLQEILCALNSSVGSIKITPICFKPKTAPSRIIVTAKNSSKGHLVLNNSIVVDAHNNYDNVVPSLFS